MKRIVREVVRYSVVYATTGVVGLGVMAWMAYRARRSPSDASQRRSTIPPNSPWRHDRWSPVVLTQDMRRRLSPERKKAGCPVGTPRQLQANGLPDVFDRLPHQALVWQLLLAAVQHCGQHASRASPQQAAQLAPQQSVAQQLADAAFALAFARAAVLGSRRRTCLNGRRLVGRLRNTRCRRWHSKPRHSRSNQARSGQPNHWLLARNLRPGSARLMRPPRRNKRILVSYTWKSPQTSMVKRKVNTRSFSAGRPLVPPSAEENPQRRARGVESRLPADKRRTIVALDLRGGGLPRPPRQADRPGREPRTEVRPGGRLVRRAGSIRGKKSAPKNPEQEQEAAPPRHAQMRDTQPSNAQPGHRGTAAMRGELIRRRGLSLLRQRATTLLATGTLPERRDTGRKNGHRQQYCQA